MGATYSYGKRIAAFQSAAGTTYYVGYEQTCEANVRPLSPEWQCKYLGDLDGIMRAIFHSASYCESGLLQGPGGREVTAEQYIGEWLVELGNPLIQDDREITLVRSNHWRANIPEQVMGEVATRLSALQSGTAGAVLGSLQEGKPVVLSLHSDIDLLDCLYGMDGLIPASRILDIKPAQVSSLRNPELGYSPVAVAPTVDPTPRVLKLGHGSNEVLIQDDQGNWRCEGWGFAAISRFVKQAWRQELQEPGTYQQHISRYRDAVMNAPELKDGGVCVILDTTAQLNPAQERNMLDFVQDTPHTVVGTEIHVPVSMADSDLWELAHLPQAAARWAVCPALNPSMAS